MASAEAEQTSVESYRLTPKLARRVALLSALVVIGFAALVMRLWALQVLAGSHYAAQAQANQVRTVRVQAPRGPIVDRNGNVLVTNMPVTSVELSPAGMPKSYARRAAEVRAIAHVAHVSVRRVTKLILERKRAGDMLDPIVIRTEATAPMLTVPRGVGGGLPGLDAGAELHPPLPARIARGAAARVRRPDLSARAADDGQAGVRAR